MLEEETQAVPDLADPLHSVSSPWGQSASTVSEAPIKMCGRSQKLTQKPGEYLSP